MRIFWTAAAPWANSGYGKPMRYLIPELGKLGHKFAIGCFYGWQGGVTQIDVGGYPVTLYPTAREKYFNDIIEFHVAAFDSDVVITLQDVWILNDWGKRGFTWLPWMPVDYSPIGSPEQKALQGCYAPISYSQWGQDELRKAGWPNARYVPFGVDLDIYQPMSQQAARKQVGLPEDGFIAGMVAANSSAPSRKSFPEVLQAWAEYKHAGGKGYLYMHTTLGPTRQKGVDLPLIMSTLGLDFSPLDNPDAAERARASVLFPSQHKQWLGGDTDEGLAAIYNSFDVLLSPSQGEGFGIPVIEAQACGVPVVTQHCTSLPELTFSGVCLEPAQRLWIDKGGWRAIADVDALTDAIRWAHDTCMTPTGREYMGTKARQGVEQFAWDNVVKEHWEPLLEEVADAIS